ncbi:MAG TPA: argininosuccinate lyase [Candidatus Limnocylindrales bacterium]|nr:argininosuccinate lyase [Candidatus Limnocylindrales bacterium]
MRLWGGRFAGPSDPRADEIGRSIDVDRVLALDDLEGSAAHVRGLFSARLLTAEERDALLGGLASLRDDVVAGRIDWDPSLEDVHLNLEAALSERVGAVGAKLHTGRSRNDQVATDLRLFARRTAADLDARLLGLERALVGLASRHAGAVLPGTTHLQPAQPVLLAHHVLAYVEMLERDRGRFADAVARLNVSPLGSGAVAGAGFRFDRAAVAHDLAFDGPTANSIDATSDRDFVVELLAAAALCGAHLSRLGEEIAWWSNPAFGFVRVPEGFATGSSMMPNKRNPDPAELVRGKAARLTGLLTGVLGLLKGLPLAYQRDLQESVEPLLDGLATLRLSLDAMTGMVEGLEVSEERMRAAASSGFSTATAVSDLLVERGVAFREAHRIVGAVVRGLEDDGVGALTEAGDTVWREALTTSADTCARGLAADPGIGQALREGATVEASLARADVVGGTAPGRVVAALDEARARLG